MAKPTENASTEAKERDQAYLTLVLKLVEDCKHIVGSDHPDAAKLTDKLLNPMRVALLQIRRLSKDAAK